MVSGSWEGEILKDGERKLQMIFKISNQILGGFIFIYEVEKGKENTKATIVVIFWNGS